MDLIRSILSICVPPLGVFLQVGFGLHFWLNIVLTIFGYFPGLLHALFIIWSVNDDDTKEINISDKWATDIHGMKRKKTTK